jgi:hypothetical protein
VRLVIAEADADRKGLADGDGQRDNHRESASGWRTRWRAEPAAIW